MVDLRFQKRPPNRGQAWTNGPTTMIGIAGHGPKSRCHRSGATPNGPAIAVTNADPARRIGRIAKCDPDGWGMTTKGGITGAARMPPAPRQSWNAGRIRRSQRNPLGSTGGSMECGTAHLRRSCFSGAMASGTRSRAASRGTERFDDVTRSQFKCPGSRTIGTGWQNAEIRAYPDVGIGVAIYTVRPESPVWIAGGERPSTPRQIGSSAAAGACGPTGGIFELSQGSGPRHCAGACA